MFKLMIIIYGLLLCPLSSRAQTSHLYTLEDLKVLAREGSYEEFLLHALDIRPGERGDAWKQMLSQVADQWARKVFSKSQITREDFLQAEKLLNLPTLRQDDVYRVRREHLGMNYLKQCLSQTPPCWDDVRSFWENDKKNPEVAFKLGELIHHHPGAPYSVWSFLESALGGPLSEFYCKRPFVLNTLWSKIQEDYARLKNFQMNQDLLKRLNLSLHTDCLPSLTLEAKARLLAPHGSLDREVAFHLLNSSGKISQDLSDFFFTVYLLENPARGELFNYAWNRLKELGGHVSRRESVLKTLSQLDPLPDSIMGSLDEVKKRAILRHLKANFPEYLDYYTNECLKFYGGKKTFPKGNPTLQCPALMSSPLAPTVVDEFKLIKFQEVKKI